MSNPTTPFGWQMPTNTDLVTDLPADFEVFGQAVATDFQYLLGGTTGQVLAKASATDLDFDWVTDATGMTNPMTTTGDVIYSSPGSTPVRLGIGTANQVLRVNSGATAPEWATPSSGGGMTLLSTTTLSGASTTISITPTGYIDLAVYVQGVTMSADETFAIQFNQVTSSNYQNLQHALDNGSANTATQFQADRLYIYAFGIDVLGTTSDNQFIINFFNCNSSERKIIEAYGQYNYNRNYLFSQTSTLYGNTAAVTELKFLCGGSVTFSGGTVLIYGVK